VLEELAVRVVRLAYMVGRAEGLERSDIAELRVEMMPLRVWRQWIRRQAEAEGIWWEEGGMKVKQEISLMVSQVMVVYLLVVREE
jgi:hypothetical protein